MNRKFFASLAILLMMASCVCAEMSLSARHLSIAPIKDGKPDYSEARFYYLSLAVHSDGTGTDSQNVTGTLTLTGGSYSYWDGQEMRNITDGGGGHNIYSETAL